MVNFIAVALGLVLLNLLVGVLFVGWLLFKVGSWLMEK